MSKRVLSSPKMSPEHVPAVELRTLLDGVGRSLRRAAVVEGIVVGVTGACAAIVAGAIASALKLSLPTIAAIELAVFLLGVSYAIVRYGRVVLGALSTQENIATWLDRVVPARGRTGLLSAIELAHDAWPGQSDALKAAAIDEAILGARQIDAGKVVKHESWISLRVRLIPLLAAAVIIAATGFFAPRHFNAAFAAITAMGRMENPLAPAVPEPRFGDFRITYRYPAYTERPTAMETEGNGDVRALPGTEVSIETHARDELREATMVISHGEGPESEQNKVAVEVDGRRLRATFVVSRGGRYRFHLKNESGDVLQEREGHAIELELDNPPEITLLEPEESPLEVNEKDRLAMIFDASDDFGLGEIFVAWRVMGSAREGRERLTAASRGSKHHAGSATLDLGPLALKPGDRVAYSLEARDNDTVNGPKIGASVTRELRVYSKTAHHQQVLALQEQSLDELVHILGDNLDSPVEVKPDPEYRKLLDASNKIVARAINADELLTRTVAAVRKDPLGQKQVAEAFESARKDLSRDVRKKRSALTLAERALAVAKAADKESTNNVRRAQDSMIGGLEKNVVYLADLLNDQRMIDAAELAKELRAQQQALKKAIEEYKNSPDPEKRKLLSQAIKDIKDRIKEITEQMAKMRGTISTDFVSPDAMKAGNSEESMDEVQKMIEDGDLDAAMAELDRMLAETEKMLSELESGREELGSREYSELAELAEKMWKDLEQLEKEQRELANKTEKTSKDVLDRMKQRLGDASSFVEKQKKRLEQAEQGLDKAKPGTHVMEGDSHDQAERRLEDAKKALEARDFGAAKEMVENAAEHMERLEQESHRRAEQARRFGDLFGGGRSADMAERELRKVRPILDEVLRDMEKLMPPPDSLLSKEERAQLEKNREKQRALKEQADKVGEQMDKLSKELPIGDPVKEKVGEASSAMGQAEGNLGQGDAPNALNQQRRAMDALAQLKQELQKMGKGSGGGGGRGVPLPFGQEEGQQGGGQEGGDGRDMSAEQRVEIPKPEQYVPPAEFRQDILDAAKQGTVEGYKEAVQRYYEELVK